MHHLIRCKLLILLHPSAFEHLCILGLNHFIITIRTSSHFSLAYMLRRMDPTPYVIMPRSWRMWLEVSLTSAGLGTLGVFHKTTWSLSHCKFACLLTLIIAFCSLWWNWIKGLFKTCAFMTTWSWCLAASSQIDWCLGSPDSIITFCQIHKCHTKLYLSM